MKKSLNLLFLYLVFIFVMIQVVAASPAIAAYRSAMGTNSDPECDTSAETLNCPKFRTWDSASGWGSEQILQSTDSEIKETVLKISPVNGKRVLITQSVDGWMDAYVCSKNCNSPSSWTVSNNIGKSWQSGTLSGNYRGFDFDFESATDDLLLVWSVSNTDPTKDLAYMLLPSAEDSFIGLPVNFINDLGHGTDIQYTWVAMDRNPISTSQELLVTGIDSTNEDVNAWRWGGSGGWGNQAEITVWAPIYAFSKETIAVEYSSDGGEGMIITLDGPTGDLAARYWAGGSGWSSVTTFDIDPGDLEDARWITLKADPLTDDLQATIVDSGADLHTAYWSGSSWSVTSNIDTSVDTASGRPADFAWYGNSGRTYAGVLVFGTDGGATGYLKRKFCNPQCDGAGTNVGSFLGATQMITLYTNPTSTETERILGIRLNYPSDLGSFYLTSTGGPFNYGDETLSADFGGGFVGLNYEAFSIAFT